MNAPAVSIKDSCISEKQNYSNKMTQSWESFEGQAQSKHNF